MTDKLNIVILGLSITSSWGNGHATTYRGLARELVKRGHSLLFLERDKPWYAANRDLNETDLGEICLYDSLDDLRELFASVIRDAHLVVVGSYVPEGIAVGQWVNDIAQGATAFYDIDTPVTLVQLEQGVCEYLSPDLIPLYDLYLSFTSGPMLCRLEQQYGSPCARALYCSFDPAMYYPEKIPVQWDLGYMGTYSDDRQPTVNALLLDVARSAPAMQFVLAGAQYPTDLKYPTNIERIQHLPPVYHRHFYNAQRFTLNVTRADMRAAGFSPSVRLFEAAACGTPIITDEWEGLDTIFDIGSEILVAHSMSDVVHYLKEMPEPERHALGLRARNRVLAEHTAAHRVIQLESHLAEVIDFAH